MMLTHDEIGYLREWCLSRNHSQMVFPPRFLTVIANDVDGRPFGNIKRVTEWLKEEREVPMDNDLIKLVIKAIVTNTSMEDSPHSSHILEKLKTGMK